MAPLWSHLEKRFHFVKVEPFFLNNQVCVYLYSGTKMVPLLEVEQLKWFLVRKWSHNQPFFCRKQYHFAKW